MATTNTLNATELPALTLEEVRQKLVTLLSEAGDLSAYIESVTQGEIVIKNFSMPLRTGCSSKPKPTLVGQTVAEHRLERLREAIRSINEDFREDRPLRLKLSKNQPSCLDDKDREIPPSP
jgi:hypothetical protein